VENSVCLLTQYAELGVADDRAQRTGVAAVDRRAHAVDDVGDLPAAAEEDAAHVIQGWWEPSSRYLR
jgi:hypothetical protein